MANRKSVESDQTAKFIAADPSTNGGFHRIAAMKATIEKRIVRDFDAKLCSPDLEPVMLNIWEVLILVCGCLAAWGMWKTRNNDIVL